MEAPKASAQIVQIYHNPLEGWLRHCKLKRSGQFRLTLGGTVLNRTTIVWCSFHKCEYALHHTIPLCEKLLLNLLCEGCQC